MQDWNEATVLPANPDDLILAVLRGGEIEIIRGWVLEESNDYTHWQPMPLPPA